MILTKVIRTTTGRWIMDHGPACSALNGGIGRLQFCPAVTSRRRGPSAPLVAVIKDGVVLSKEPFDAMLEKGRRINSQIKVDYSYERIRRWG